jgi:hypothetical protein
VVLIIIKYDEATKRLRVVSCFGVPATTTLSEVKTKQSFILQLYVVGVGVEIIRDSWLLKAKDEYAKSRLSCVKMPT